MTAPHPYIGLAVHAAVCVTLGAGLLIVASLLRHRVKHAHAAKGETYECGETPVGEAWRKMPSGFYLVALLFILFDIETAFLFLWVQSLREIGVAAFWAMTVFIVVLLLGWVYAWRKGDLHWTR
jgi:NADH-quinone oxidoreductase subunit A